MIHTQKQKKLNSSATDSVRLTSSDLGSAFTALPVVLLGWALGLGGGAQLFLVVQARGLAAGERRMAAGERRIKVGCVPEVG